MSWCVGVGVVANAPGRRPLRPLQGAGRWVGCGLAALGGPACAGPGQVQPVWPAARVRADHGGAARPRASGRSLALPLQDSSHPETVEMFVAHDIHTSPVTSTSGASQPLRRTVPAPRRAAALLATKLGGLGGPWGRLSYMGSCPLLPGWRFRLVVQRLRQQPGALKRWPSALHPPPADGEPLLPGMHAAWRPPCAPIAICHSSASLPAAPKAPTKTAIPHS